ncbi:MAG TPA: sulfotransferase [Thermoanaerobaculia bacterium]
MDRSTFDEPAMPAVFVLSAPRSGSTLLRYLLDTHSRIASPGEIFLARLCFDLELAISRTAGAVAGPGGKTGDERATAEARRVVAGIMEAYARSKGKDVWCDKSPRNVEYLESLTRTFPQAKYVCLYRNCMDTVKSMLGASQTGFMLELAAFAAKTPGNLVAAMIDAWCDYNGKILAFEAAHPENTFRIRYEDVVLDPAGALRPLFEFLGVGWEPQVVERALEAPHDEGGGDLYIRYTRAIDRANIGKGSTIPFFRIQPALAPMNAMLERLGYPQVGPDWNERPSPYLPPEAAGTPAAPEAPAASGSAAQAGSAADGIELSDYFLKRLPETLAARAAEAGKANASVKFVVQGAEGAERGIFWVELRGTPRVLAEDLPADCTLTLPREVLMDIANGRLNPVAAFGQSKIKVHGPLPLAAHMMRFV